MSDDTSATSGHLHLAAAGDTQVITIDRAEAKNALNRAMRIELCDLLAAADKDPAIGSVVLTGADPVFTAGVDFKETDPRFDSYQAQFAVNPGRALRAMRTPVICAVNGACVSGGLEIALSSTFIVASERARFADTHARLNAVPTWGLTALLPRAVGIRQAREMSITGNFVDGPTALRIGLVNHVVPHDDLLDFCLTLASQIAKTPATHEILSLYDLGLDLGQAGALAAENDHTSRRHLDPEAFASAGSAAALRQRSGDGGH
jgi:enoyl-CoA hydratase